MMYTTITSTCSLPTLLEISLFSVYSVCVTLFLLLFLFLLASVDQNDQFTRVKPSASGSRRQLVKVLTHSLLCTRNIYSSSSHYIEGTIRIHYPLLTSYTVTHSCVDGMAPLSLNDPSLPVSLMAFGQGMALSTYVMGALLLGQMSHEPFTFEGYILTAGWIFSRFVLAATFTAELASFLSVEVPEELVRWARTKKYTAPHSLLQCYYTRVTAPHQRLLLFPTYVHCPSFISEVVENRQVATRELTSLAWKVHASHIYYTNECVTVILIR